MRSSRNLRILLIGALSAVLAAPGSGAPAPRQGSARLRLSAERPVMEPAGGGRRVVPRLRGFGSAGRRGQPMLPTRTLMVAIPEGSTPELRILSATSEPLGAVEIAPTPGVRVTERLDRPRGIGGKPRGRGPAASEDGLQDYEDDFTADDEVYARDEETPSAAVRLGATGYLREQRYVEVIYSPVLYNPARGRARLVRDVDAEVVFTMPEGSAPAESVLFEPDPQFEDTYRDSLVNYEQGKLFRVHSGESSETSLQMTTGGLNATAAAGAVRYKVAVSRAGIYRLDYAYLLANAPELLAVNPQLLTLSAEGVEVPISIRDGLGNSGELDGNFGTGDFLEFYGQPKREAPTSPSSNLPPGSPNIFQANDFTDTQIYWLEALDPAGSHRRIPSVNLPVSPVFPVAPHFQDQAVWDENNLYLPLEDNDPFFSIPSLLAGSTQATRDIGVPLPGLAPVSATANVAIRLRGGSDLTVSLDHRTRIWVNSDTAGGAEPFWDGEIIQPVGFSEPQTVLTNPTTVHFSAPGQAGVSLDKQYLDSVTISYRRLFSATGDVLLFSYPNQDTRFQVSGFSGTAATIYEVTRTLASSLEADPVRLTGASAAGLPVTLTFDVPRDPSPSAPATRWFFVAGPSGVPHPDGMTRAADPVLHDTANAADMIVIGTPATIDPAVGGALYNLLAYRSSSQQLTSKVVFVDQIYDEFSYGLRDPNAIRTFLAYAFDNWHGAGGTARPPSFVLLVGDATPDYKDTLGPVVNPDWVDQVPTVMMFQRSSILGYYSSDNLLASFRGADQIPDIYLGRISTRTAADSAEVFDKIRLYEQSPPAGLWKGRALLLAGDGKNPIETADFEGVQNDLASAWFSTPPYSVPSPPLYFAKPPWNLNITPFRNAMFSEIQAGVAVMSYVGHGSFELWGSGGQPATFFTTQEAAQLTNGGYLPFMININCLTGGFHDLSAVGSVAEGMTNNPNGGAIAALAPSGLSNAFIGDLANTTLFKSLFGISRNRLISAGATAFRMSMWSQDHVVDAQSYTFLGDPATRIVTPAPAPPTGLTASAGNGQVTLSWTASPDAVGYRIRRATAASGPYTTATCDPLTATSCVDRTVVNATAYYYYAVSLDSSGFWGGASNDNSDCDLGPGCVRALPINPGPPSVPVGLSVNDGGTGNTLILSWQANSERDIRTYNIYYGQVQGQYPTKLTFGPGVTSSLLTGLQDGIRYYFVISATNTSGNESAVSDPVSNVPHLIQGIAPPRSITDLDVTRSGSNLVLSWTAPTVDVYGRPTTVARYEIYAATAPDALKSASHLIGTNIGAANTTFTHTGAATSPGNLFYVVIAIDTNGFASGAGKELPNGISDLNLLLVTASPQVVRISWPAITTDLLGFPTTIHHYQIHRTSVPVGRQSLDSTTIFRDNIQVLSVDLDLTALAGPSYFSVIAVDNQGNLSPY